MAIRVSRIERELGELLELSERTPVSAAAVGDADPSRAESTPA
jgi:hypothetical protein